VPSTFELDPDASRDLTSDELQRIEKLVHQISAKTVDLHQLTAELNSNERSVIAQLKSLRQEDQDARASDQRALHAKLDVHHEAVQWSQKTLQKTLTAIGQAQVDAVSVQRQVLSGTTQTRKQTARMSRDVITHLRAADQQGQRTTDLIIAKLRDIEVTAVKQMSAPPSSGREIVYCGKRQDIILPTLYSYKMDLAMAFDELRTRRCQDIDPDHLSWLESEFQNLLASAAQEEARLHPRSTATSFDTWIVPGGRRIGAAHERQDTPLPTEHHQGKATAPHQRQNTPLPTEHRQGKVLSDASQGIRRYRQKFFHFKTARGIIQIRLPQRDHLTQMLGRSDEVGVSLMPVTTELPSLEARFIRLKERSTAPRIYGQLNIFLPLDFFAHMDSYIKVIGRGSVQDVDEALRNGIICPYRQIELEGTLVGTNPMIFVSHVREIRYKALANFIVRCKIRSCRCSALLGFSGPWNCRTQVTFANFPLGLISDNHRQNTSISHGISVMFTLSQSSTYHHLASTLADLLSCCVDPSKTLMESIFLTLVCIGDTERSENHWSALTVYLLKLFAINSDVASQGRDIEPKSLRRHPELLPDLVRVLLQGGLDPNIGFLSGLSLLGAFMADTLFKKLRSDAEGHVIRKRIFSTVIEFGADISYRCRIGYSTADWAWGYGHWDAWCEALQEHGIAIQEANQSVPQGCWIKE
jgi:hypothetical protein